MALKLNNVIGSSGTVVTSAEYGTSFIQVEDLADTFSNCGLVIIKDVIFKKHDISIPIAAVNDERFIYVFGQNFGDIIIKGSVFIGPSDNQSIGSGLSLVNAFYEDKRLAKSKKSINVSFGGSANIKFKAYINDLSVEGGNTDMGEFLFSITGWIAPTPTGSK